MSDFEVTYMATDELDKLGYTSKIQAKKDGGQLRCSCCGRQLKRDYISGWKRGWRYCIGCGARIMGTEN
jgi:hypothetical protein